MTDSIAKIIPSLSSIKDSASGMVSFALPGRWPRRFIGFRPEVLRTINWGGDPRKPVEQDEATRPHPRRSFALWREEVRLRSVPWTPRDLEAAEELRRVVVEVDLEKQVRREQRAVRARDDLVAVVSHDLKNPLNVIQMQAALLRSIAGADADERAARLHAGVDRIQRSVSRMDTLIHDLLDLAKIEAGRFVLQRRVEPAHEMLEETLVTLSPLADAKGVFLREEVKPDIKVLADRERVYQVLSNLVGNAIKFTPPGGHVVLRAEADGGKALFA